jgi:hypothetical protein
MKGAAVGAAAGMTLGGAKGLSEGSPEQKISEDLQQRTLEKKPVPPEEVSHGFIFFPGEAKGASELRLSIREIDTGKQYNLIMKY